MTSEAKIYIILSKEWKINRYGPWIFHQNIFRYTSVGLLLPRHGGKALWVCGGDTRGHLIEGWPGIRLTGTALDLSHVIARGFVPMQWGRTQEPQATGHGAITCLSRFFCRPCLCQSCFYPLWEGTVRLTRERGDD